jgi:hypothetical protein
MKWLLKRADLSCLKFFEVDYAKHKRDAALVSDLKKTYALSIVSLLALACGVTTTVDGGLGGGGSAAGGGGNVAGGNAVGGGIGGGGNVAGGNAVGGGNTIDGGGLPFRIWTPGPVAVAPSQTGKTLYVDGANGSDAANGLTLANALKTIARAKALVTAGDTVLIKAGLYREGIAFVGGTAGTPTKPITFGSLGDGEVILDGSTRVTGWVVHTGTVFKAVLNFVPIAVVVNDVPLKQVRQGQNGSTAPREDLAGVTPGSGKWFFDGVSKTLYADFGSVNPTTADIVVPNDDGAQTHVYFYNVNDVVLKGLTIRGSGSNGMWTYGGCSRITVESCNFKFNGKAGVVFNGGEDNKVLYSQVYQNVMLNWPRGNNGNAEAGGGWAGGLAFSSEVRPIARGNLVHMNGGEGIITYGNTLFNGTEPGRALFEQNVAYDNWSVNMYLDCQPYGIARQNVLFNHLPDASQFLYVSAPNTGYPYDGVLEKFRICLSISDEFISTRNGDGVARNTNTQVYNNIIAGCRVGIFDYKESVTGHGFRNALIANNTIVLDTHVYTTTYSAGMFLQDNGSANVASSVVNNIIVGGNSSSSLINSYGNAALTGISFNQNMYFSTRTAAFAMGNNSQYRDLDFAGWKNAQPGQDGASLNVNPNLQQQNLVPAAPGIIDYRNAKLQAGSSALGAGVVRPELSTDFAGTPRVTPWNIGAF